MDQRTVSWLEKEVEDSIADAIKKTGSTRLPASPTQRTIHLMAKAAVTVYEAAVEAGNAEE